MKILTLTVILGLPLMALGQTTEPQQSQEQTKDTQTTAPAKQKKMRPEQAEPGKSYAKPETNTNVRGQTNVKGRTQEMNRNEPGVNRNEAGVRSSTNETNMKGTSQTTTVNKQEAPCRHECARRDSPAAGPRWSRWRDRIPAARCSHPPLWE